MWGVSGLSPGAHDRPVARPGGWGCTCARVPRRGAVRVAVRGGVAVAGVLAGEALVPVAPLPVAPAPVT